MSLSFEDKRRLASVVFVLSLISFIALAYFTFIWSPDSSGTLSGDEADTLEEAMEMITDKSHTMDKKLDKLDNEKNTLQMKINESEPLLTHTISQKCIGGILSFVIGLLATTILLYTTEKRNMFSK